MRSRTGSRPRVLASPGRLAALGAAVAAATAAFAAAPAVASANGRSSAPFGFYTASMETENCVEQQSGGLSNCGTASAVVNPTNCIWTVDQYTMDNASGDLPGGATATDHMCLIADGMTNWWGEPHWISASVTSSRDNLDVTLSDQFGNSWALQPTAGKSSYTWSLCMGGPSFSSYPTVPNSNGGYGVQDDYTLSVRNASTQTARSLSASFEIQGTTGPC